MGNRPRGLRRAVDDYDIREGQRLVKWFSCLPLLVLSLSAEGVDGNEFLRYCNAWVKQADGGIIEDPEEFFGQMYCGGYLHGFTDSHSLETTFGGKGNGPPYCLPENGVEGGQLVRIVTKYLRENPDTLHEHPRVSIFLV